MKKLFKNMIGQMVVVLLIIIIGITAYLSFREWDDMRAKIQEDVEFTVEVLSEYCRAFFNTPSGELVETNLLNSVNYLRKLCESSVDEIQIKYVNKNKPDNIYVLKVNRNTVDQTDSESFANLLKEEAALVNGEAVTMPFSVNDKNEAYAYLVPLSDDNWVGLVEIQVKQNLYMRAMLSEIAKYVIRIFEALVIFAILISVMFYLKVVSPVRRAGQLLAGIKEKGAISEKAMTTVTGSIGEFSPELAQGISDVENITRNSTAREAELDIARKIQNGMLPPPAYTGAYVTIKASLKMMDAVGGDLYQYFDIDDDRVFLAVGDVSGHGVSAAMLMSSACISLRNNAMWYKDPARVLAEVNNDLAGINPERLFVTLFAAVFNKKTGVLTYANGGHNKPFLIGKELKALNGAGGLLLGIFPGEVYTSETVSLSPGDTLVLYTDGLTEAFNENKDMYGEERLKACLLSHRNGPAVINQISSDLKEFLAGKEVTDDVTLLTMTFENRKVFSLPAKIESWETVRSYIYGIPWIETTEKLGLCLAAEEIMVNIVSYAYEDTPSDDNMVEVDIESDDNKCQITFIDSGKPYNQAVSSDYKIGYDPTAQIGGAGRILISGIADKIHYDHHDGKNIFRIEKSFDAAERNQS
ncbi:MAG: SpoIIE family protein phosphatase [Lachnospiraceae bacterium]|nr:SpoIIE family protein phosphatase [Lachnospiraceae bacterium]